MMYKFCFFLSVCIATLLSANASRHVILVSIDGLRPEMYIDARWPTPNLRYLVRNGVKADHMKSVFPSYTYPSHIAMLTGALPSRSGIYFNQPKNSKGEWNWFTDSVKVPTLWSALKQAGLTTAAIEWPVSVSKDITYCIPEIWDIKHPEDRITKTREYATPGLLEEIERNATGRLDSTNMSEGYFSMDANSARMASYIFSRYKPAFLAVHFASVDGMQHEYGTTADSLSLAASAIDRCVGDILEAVNKSGLKDSTTVIIVGDHGFSDIHTAFKVNMLIKDLPVRFTPAGGSAFLYSNRIGMNPDSIIAIVKERLNTLPKNKSRLFRVVERNELDKMGVDSSALLALAAMPGLVFSGSIKSTPPASGSGNGTFHNSLDSLFVTAYGGHHGYDPNLPEMFTGFIAEGADVNCNKTINELCVTDVALLIARLLGLKFEAIDGKPIKGILSNDH